MSARGRLYLPDVVNVRGLLISAQLFVATPSQLSNASFPRLLLVPGGRC